MSVAYDPTGREDCELGTTAKSICASAETPKRKLTEREEQAYGPTGLGECHVPAEGDIELYRYDYSADETGKCFRVKSNVLYGWAAINTHTGEVELGNFQEYDDDLTELADPWEWRKFVLTLDQRRAIV